MHTSIYVDALEIPNISVRNKTSAKESNIFKTKILACVFQNTTGIHRYYDFYTRAFEKAA